MRATTSVSGRRPIRGFGSGAADGDSGTNEFSNFQKLTIGWRFLKSDIKHRVIEHVPAIAINDYDGWHAYLTKGVGPDRAAPGLHLHPTSINGAYNVRTP